MRPLRRRMGRVRRLDGKRLVIDGGRVVTAYRAGRGPGCRLIRHAEERELAAWESIGCGLARRSFRRRRRTIQYFTRRSATRTVALCRASCLAV